MSDKKCQYTAMQFPLAVHQAAEWVDRLTESCDRQVLRAWRDWIRQSPENFEEFLLAVAIDLLLIAHGDSEARGSNDTSAE